MKEIVGYPDTASRLVEVWEEGMVMMAGEGLSPIISCSPLSVTIHSLVDFFLSDFWEKKKKVVSAGFGIKAPAWPLFLSP